MKVIDLFEDNSFGDMTPKQAYEYATKCYNNHDEVPIEIENIIANIVEDSFYYASLIMGKSFPMGEDAISKEAKYAYKYAKDILGKRWKKGEAAIATDAMSSYYYAYEVLHKPFKAGTAAIATDAHYSRLYAKNVLKGQFKSGEPIISQNPYNALYYAIDSLKTSFPAGEAAISTIPSYYRIYLQMVYNDKLPGNAIAKLLNNKSTIKKLDKEDYDNLVKEMFPTSSLLVNKWIRFGDRLRGRINESN